MPILDDKNLVIICSTLLGLAALWALQDPTTVITSVITGLFGVAVGRQAAS